MYSKVFPANTFPVYKYVVTFSRWQGQWLFSRHKGRTTWETQGGHVEMGKTTEEAARRELWEESGATSFSIRHVCDYWAGDVQSSAVGAVFLAEIETLGPLPESEMAEIRLFDGLPDDLTYPGITPELFREINQQAK